MSRINDYPEAFTMADDDILVIDGAQGTRKVKKSKFVEIISEHVDGEISEMRQDFQAGVDTIYNAEQQQNVSGVPTASTPQALADGVGAIATAKYNSGKSDGITQGRADKNSFTIEFKRGSLIMDNGGTIQLYNLQILVNGIDILQFTGGKNWTLTVNKPTAASTSKTAYASYTGKVTKT